MPGGGDVDGALRGPIVYCLIPRALAAKLHEPLRRHFREDPQVRVVVERRDLDRRSHAERRTRQPRARKLERRRVRSAEGRRAGERRVPGTTVAAPELPRRFRRYAPNLAFFERIEPSGQHVEDLDTARLVARFQAGEPETFSSLYVRYFDRVYAYLRLVLRDQHEAEDATQQVFLQVMEALPAYERRRQPFRAWLFVIARNHALRVAKQTSRLQPTDPSELRFRREPIPCEEPFETLDWLTDSELLLFVERLPLVQRQVVVLRYMLDLSHREIAAVLDRSNEDVRILLHRAQRFLRERLTAVGRAPKIGRSRTPALTRPRQVTVLRARRFRLLGHRYTTARR